MNSVTLVEINRSVNIEPITRKVDVEVIRIHTDYHFLSLYQTTTSHTEV
jgi:hypothetical protein